MKYYKQAYIIPLIMVAVAALYLAGLRILFPIILITTLAIIMPMPRAFSSWLSRLIVALFFFYALLQVSALLQFYSAPNAGFSLIAVITAGLVAVLNALYGQPWLKRPVVSKKDGFALLGCSIFILAFIPILSGRDSVYRITELSGVQVIDSIAHDAYISSLDKLQNLNYAKEHYYPYGFHIATAFTQNSFLNDTEPGWKQHAIIYFGEYIVLGLLMAYVAIYLGFEALNLYLRSRVSKWSQLALALSIGFGLTFMHLFLFVYLGFLNYFYICTTVLLAVTYLLGLGRTKEMLTRSNAQSIALFYLLTFGASLSWPLFTPSILLMGLLAVFAFRPHIAKKTLRKDLLPLILPVILFILNAGTVLIQMKYARDNEWLLNLGGALHNFNLAFLLIGLACVAWIIQRSDRDIANKTLVIIGPFALLSLGLMIMQYTTLGEARYYLIKSTMLLEMLLIVVVSIAVVIMMLRSQLNIIWSSTCAVIMVGFIIVGTMITVPQPFAELRNLFRNVSGIQPPPYLQSDARQLAGLGSGNGIKNFNVTTLHYNKEADIIFAHIETASWANAMAKTYSKQNVALPPEECFAKQFTLLSTAPVNADQQKTLVESVQECSRLAASAGEPYYIVTDHDSVDRLHQLLGDTVTLVY